MGVYVPIVVVKPYSVVCAKPGMIPQTNRAISSVKSILRFITLLLVRYIIVIILLSAVARMTAQLLDTQIIALPGGGYQSFRVPRRGIATIKICQNEAKITKKCEAAPQVNRSHHHGQMHHSSHKEMALAMMTRANIS